MKKNKMYIKRFKSEKDFTLGIFLLLNENDDFIQSGFTLEPGGPDTTARGMNKRVPVGIYDASIRYSPKYRCKTPHIYNLQVPKDRYILMHVGNTSSDTTGCILIGETVTKNSVLNSRKAFNTLMNNLKDNDFEVEIV